MLKEINSLKVPLEEESSLIKLDELDSVLDEIVHKLPSSSRDLDDGKIFLEFLDEIFRRNQELSFSKKVEMFTKILSEQEKSEFGVKRIIDFVKHKINTTEFVFAFIKKSRDKYSEITETMSCEELGRLQKNKYLNYLRLVGILPPEDYDGIHRAGLYNFSERLAPNAFAEQLQSYVINVTNGMSGMSGIMQGKEVVSLGSGACSDEISFLETGSKSVRVIDSSNFVLDKVRERLRDCSEDIQKKLILPEEAQDMFSALKEMKEKGEKTEVIYSHSSLHFFDMDRFKTLLSLIKDCLVPNGHLVFAVKAPGAMMDGKGICIVNQESQTVAFPDDDIAEGELEKNTTKVFNRGWLNEDGILRFYRDMDVVEKVLNEAGFCIKRVTKDTLENYAVDDVNQVAYYFICQSKN